MNILTLLQEAGRPVYHNPITGDNPSVEQLMEIIEKHAVSAFNAYTSNPNMILYRGMSRDIGDVMLQDTLASQRTSQNTYNYVTVLTSMMQSWSHLKPRSSGVSCSSEHDNAASYAASPEYMYVALPADNTQVVYYGAPDFWDAFPGIAELSDNKITQVNELNVQLRSIHTQLSHIPGCPAAMLSPSDMTKLANLIDRAAEGDDLNVDMNRLESNILFSAFLDSGFETFLEFVEDMLDPSGFRVTTGASLLRPGRSEEVFLAGSILYIRESVWKTLI